jgi:hypothetical protein
MGSEERIDRSFRMFVEAYRRGPPLYIDGRPHILGDGTTPLHLHAVIGGSVGILTSTIRRIPGWTIEQETKTADIFSVSLRNDRTNILCTFRVHMQKNEWVLTDIYHSL